MSPKSRDSDPAVETPAPPRHTLREQVAGTVKVILLTGGLLGGLWLLQMIAKN